LPKHKLPKHKLPKHKLPKHKLPKHNVAFIGLGIMGAPMAMNLLRAGFSLRVYNRTREKARDLVTAGASQYDSPAEAARDADVIVTMVTDTPDVRAVVFGDDGALATARRGALIVDMSTIRPDATRRFAAQAAERGVAWLDAPVSGGDVGAKNATLTIMVGGDPADFERARPLFDTLGKRVTLLGPVGSGQAVKACNQILCAVNLLGVCEALALAESQDIDREKLLSSLGAGAGGSWALENLGPKLVQADFAPGFMIDLLLKDLGIVADCGRGESLPLPAAALAEQLFRAASALGHGRLGTQAVALAYRALGAPRRD
jgi:3-hydroxyisobutyrate dehydrogenase